MCSTWPCSSPLPMDLSLHSRCNDLWQMSIPFSFSCVTFAEEVSLDITSELLRSPRETANLPLSSVSYALPSSLCSDHSKFPAFSCICQLSVPWRCVLRPTPRFEWKDSSFLSKFPANSFPNSIWNTAHPLLQVPPAICFLHCNVLNKNHYPSLCKAYFNGLSYF